jgi:hypothetical protein
MADRYDYYPGETVPLPGIDRAASVLITALPDGVKNQTDDTRVQTAAGNVVTVGWLNRYA